MFRPKGRLKRNFKLPQHFVTGPIGDLLPPTATSRSYSSGKPLRRRRRRFGRRSGRPAIPHEACGTQTCPVAMSIFDDGGIAGPKMGTIWADHLPNRWFDGTCRKAASHRHHQVGSAQTGGQLPSHGRGSLTNRFARLRRLISLT